MAEASPPAITKDQVLAGKLRQVAHLNGGSKWFGYMYEHTTLPRLRRIDRYIRGTRTVEHEWRVDGGAVADIDAAVAALNCPVVLTAEETTALAHVSADWQPLRQVETLMSGLPADTPRPTTIEVDSPFKIGSRLSHALAAKGVVEIGRAPGDDRTPMIRLAQRAS